MDPYLEHPRFFPDLHSSLIFAIKEQLQPILPQSYYAQSGERVWLETSERYVEPDANVTGVKRKSEPSRHASSEGGVAVAEPEVETEAEGGEPVVITIEKAVDDEHIEPFLEIRGRCSGQDRLVAAIEVLSPSNKAPGDQGFDTYRAKQRDVLASQVHLIEIDLLRGGTHITAVPVDLAREKAGPFDYHVSVHRFDVPKAYFVYPIRMQERQPIIRIPLLPGDPSVRLDLQAAFSRAYDAGPYRKRILYGEDLIEPPLQAGQDSWAKAVLEATTAGSTHS
jgi:hypothetical protein